MMFPSGIIASIQPRWNSPFNNKESIAAFALECAPHAVALRIMGLNNIIAVNDILEQHGLDLPVIGLIKKRENGLNTLITPTVGDAEMLMEAGATYVAMECTDRLPVDRIVEAVNKGMPVVADVGDLKNADIAKGCGACALTTALSGYLDMRTHPFCGPDIDLLRKCVSLKVPVIAEGRYRTPNDFEMAREAGAYAVCMGAAIHEPRTIIHYSQMLFNGSWKVHVKNGFRDLF